MGEGGTERRNRESERHCGGERERRQREGGGREREIDVHLLKWSVHLGVNHNGEFLIIEEMWFLVQRYLVGCRQGTQFKEYT